MKKSISLILFTLLIVFFLASLFSCYGTIDDSDEFPIFGDIDTAKDSNKKPSNPNFNPVDSSTNIDSDINIDIDFDSSQTTDTDADIDIDSEPSIEPDYSLIIFNTDGGSKIENIIIRLGEDYTLPTPSKDGYSFLGWYFGNNKIETSGKWNLDNTEIELTAKWEKNITFEFNIEYDFNGGKKGTGIFPSGYNSTDKAFQIGRPIKEGNFKFIGWQSSNGEIVFNYNVDEGSTGDISLKAIWYEYKYTYQDTKGYQYLLKNDNTLSVVGYVGNVSNLLIPSTYNEYTVTEIGPYAFCGYGDKIASIQTSGFVRCDIADTVTKIAIGAFAGCDDLKVQLSYKSEMSIGQWTENLTIEEENNHVLDVIKGDRPAIGWKKYWKPGA